MRLCRPTLAAEQPLRFSADELGHACAAPEANAQSACDDWSHRFVAERHGVLDGSLLLPQSFGTIHLGECFTSFVSVANFSERGVGNVGIKAELQSDTQRTVLYETPAPVPVLCAGERRDVVVEHDLKEAGPHTLVCSAVYTDADGERRYLPQYFKFNVAQPLSVRTKVRSLPGGAQLLEACVENLTSEALSLESLVLEPASTLQCQELGALDDQAHLALFPHSRPDEPGVLTHLLRRHAPLPPTGGARHALFRLTPKPHSAPTASALASTDPPGALGKLEIRWRGRFGDGGRLQTQTILAAAPPIHEVTLSLVCVPALVQLEQAFSVTARVRNGGRARTSALRLTSAAAPPTQPHGAPGSALAAPPPAAFAGIVLDGEGCFAVGELAPGESREVRVSCLPLALGVARLPTLSLLEEAPVAVGAPRVLDTAAGAEVLVLA